MTRRKKTTLTLLLWLFLTTTTAAIPYNRPNCDQWPSRDSWDSLRNSLSPNAALHGPFTNNPSYSYSANCYFQNQERVVLLTQGKGLCLARHQCANEKCRLSSPLDLPAYTVEAHTALDVQEAVQFAQEHNLGVSVKSSGHSFQGQSTIADSLLIWMRHFEQTNVVNPSFTDSCNTTHATLQVAGGQNFDDVFFAIKNDYHISSGSCQTVVLGGGWLMGGGASWTARKYGFGVDNVVSMNVVLADGTLVTADACNESQDLFWAMRGGGGGNFGIITQLEYELHPPTNIVVLRFEYRSRDVIFQSKDKKFAARWMDLLIQEMPGLEREWGGAWSPVGGRFMFAGTLEEARASAWIAMVDDFYNSMVEDGLDPDFGLPSTILEEYDGFHDQNGGDESYENPDFDGSAETVPTWYDNTFSRVLPVELLQEKPIELRDLIVDMWFKKQVTHPENYVFGGRTMDVDPEDTAIHPAMRKGVMEIRLRNAKGRERIDALLNSGNYLWSVCYNHHSPVEPNYQEACWGDNYGRLQSIKEKYDPDHRFNVYHGVNYREPIGSSDCPRKKKYGVISGGMFYLNFVIGVFLDFFGGIFDSALLLFCGF